MRELNVRIVRPGASLYVWTREACVTGPDLSPDVLERACTLLTFRYGLPAIPLAGSGRDRRLLVAASRPIPNVRREADSWMVDIADARGSGRQVRFADPDGPVLLPPLLERTLLMRVDRLLDLWSLDSARIRYEAQPLADNAGIAAYRRFEISSLPIDDAGVGLAIELGIGFFTTRSLAFFFDPSQPSSERKRREEWFKRLTARQLLQKGTLLYDNSRNRLKCYFEGEALGVTPATTGPLRIRSQTYPSLLAYYQSEYPRLHVDPNGPVVRVSFPNLRRPQFVAAERVWIRVMHDEVPETLEHLDKIGPDERRALAIEFWQRLGDRPLGTVAPGLLPGFFRPGPDRVFHIPIPALVFGANKRLEPPSEHTSAAYRAHFRDRAQNLEKNGCYQISATMPRTLECAFPENLESAAMRLAADVATALSTWTGIAVKVHSVPYRRRADAIAQLRAERPAGLLFVMDDDPAAYFDLAFQLSDWRIKRVTERVLAEQDGYRTKGSWDRRLGCLSRQRGQARWRDFTTMNALDLLQKLDGIPFRAVDTGAYDAHLVIDVGHERRYFSLSLFVARAEDKTPSFLIETRTEHKADQRADLINAAVLRDRIIELIDGALLRPCDPLASLLVLRDGYGGPGEISATDQAIERLVALGKIAAGARVDFSEIHKDSQKGLRAWDVGPNGAVTNPLECDAVLLNKSMTLVTTTGEATLHQGTAEPFLIVGNGRCSSIRDVTEAVVIAAQHNWSNPRVAQKHHVALKRTDEELTTRASQEIRRYQ